MYNFSKYLKSKLINIKKFYNDYIEDLQTNNMLQMQKKDIAEILKFDTENEENFKEFQKLYSSVSVGLHLKQDSDVEVFKFHPGLTDFNRESIIEIPTDALNLNTVASVINFKKKYVGSPFGLSELSYKSIHNSNSNKNLNNLEPYNDVLIAIRFYRPFCYRNYDRINAPKFSEEFYVLGSQYLTELKDKIYCICNNKRFIEISNDPNQDVQTINDKNPGFFFITDTFYNDTRNPENPDYSEVIRVWLSEHKDFKNLILNITAKMEETTFFDLNVELGYPYVYQHHGNCEHLFTFSWIRLLSPEDILNRNSYPILKSIQFPNSKICDICAKREYTHIVMESERQFHDPCHLCRICFLLFFYVNGKKIGNFKAYKIKSNDEIHDEVNDSDLEEVNDSDLEEVNADDEKYDDDDDDDDSSD